MPIKAWRKTRTPQDENQQPMALLIYGKRVCSLCGKLIKQEDPSCSFPPFVVNELDPCFLFSDGAFHEACVLKHKHGVDAIRRVEEWAANVGPGKRKCVVCKTEITDPDDYLLIEHLSDREGDPMREFNYTHLHKSCLSRWEGSSRFTDLANATLASNSWKGPSSLDLLRRSKLGVSNYLSRNPSDVSLLLPSQLFPCCMWPRPDESMDFQYEN
jgi:predicted nucleic acid-binding Zn ribbon protein